MTIRTISQLEPIDVIGNDDLFNVSKYETTGYTSKSITFGNLTMGISSLVRDCIANEWEVPETVSKFDNEKFSMQSMIDRIYKLSADNMTFYGVKTFAESPLVPDIPIEADNMKVPNSHTVKRMIQAYSNTIAPSSIVDFDPENNAGHTVYNADKALIWHFDDNTDDSSRFIVDEYTRQEAGYITCNHDGWLNIYGWITDGGNVLPQEAWVGLFAKLKVVNQSDPADTPGTDAPEEQVVMVQCQPWIVGSKSSTMQYVSFGIPVKAGLQLKVKTGFKVSGNSTGLQHSNSLLFNDAGNMPNTLVGYIIYNQ